MNKKIKYTPLFSTLALCAFITACGGGGGGNGDNTPTTPITPTTSETETNTTTTPQFQLFQANEGGIGANGLGNGTLWATDGTANGTQQLTTAETHIIGPSVFTTDGKKAFIPIRTTATGSELWISDGTANGTKIIKDTNISGSTNGLQSGYLMQIGNEVYYFGVASNTQLGIIKTDGTEQGTEPVLIRDSIITFNGNNYKLNNQSMHPVSDGKLIYGTLEKVSDNVNYMFIFDPSKSGNARLTVLESTPIDGVYSASSDGSNTWLYLNKVNSQTASLELIKGSTLTEIGTEAIVSGVTDSNRRQHKANTLMALTLSSTSAQIHTMNSNGQPQNSTLSLPSGITYRDFNLRLITTGVVDLNGYMYAPLKASSSSVGQILRIAPSGSTELVSIGNKAGTIYPNNTFTKLFEKDDKLYVYTDNENHQLATSTCKGIEVWVISGTTADMVKDVNTNACSRTNGNKSMGIRASIGPVGEDKLLFIGQDATSGHEPFILNGATGDIQILKDLTGNSDSSTSVTTIAGSSS